MIKVLQSVSSLGIGGNELSVMNFFRNIDKTQFQVDFLIYDERLEFAEEVKAAGAKIYLCPQKKTNKLARIFNEAKFVYRTLRKNDYDIIHCNGCSFVNIFRAVLPAKLAGNVKVISHSHNVGNAPGNVIEKAARQFLKWLLSSTVDLGFTCSDLAGASKYTKSFIESKKYILINNAVKVEKYLFSQANRDEIRNRYGIADKCVVGHVGRLAEQKNQGFLLNLFADCWKDDSKMALLLVGGGAMEMELKEKAEALGICDKVIFTGSVFDAEKYYSAMDVFVMPSLYEGLPFTAIEAQVNGLKCVLSDEITKTANVSGDVVYLPLAAEKAVWADVVAKQAEKRSQADSTEKVIINYDINKETQKLQRIYREIV